MIYRILFRRPDGEFTDAICILDVDCNESDLETEAVMVNLTAALTAWVKSTETGKEVWEDSSEDLNVGDMDGYWDDVSLQPYLKQNGVLAVYGLDPMVRLEEQSYDRVLVNRGELEE